MSTGGVPLKTNISSLIRDTWVGLLDLVYPPKCLVCGDIQSEYFCEKCRAEIVPITPPICFVCGASLVEGYCRDCHSGTEFAFDAARAVASYEGTIKEAIHQLKYSGHRIIAPALGAMLVEFLQTKSDIVHRADCVIPMPVHPSKERQRGFNQAELIAREVADAFALPLLTNALIRSKPTRPQVDLSLEARKTNTLGAFEVVRVDGVTNRCVLLIDDVLTTGGTAHAAAWSLKEVGAREVLVATVARAI